MFNWIGCFKKTHTVFIRNTFVRTTYLLSIVWPQVDDGKTWSTPPLSVGEGSLAFISRPGISCSVISIFIKNILDVFLSIIFSNFCNQTFKCPYRQLVEFHSHKLSKSLYLLSPCLLNACCYTYSVSDLFAC